MRPLSGSDQAQSKSTKYEWHLSRPSEGRLSDMPPGTLPKGLLGSGVRSGMARERR